MDNIKEFNSANKGSKQTKSLLIILILLVAALGTTSILLHFSHKKTIAKVEQVSLEKETLTFQFQNLLDDFDTLETSNDSISTQLSAEKERITELMTMLRTTKAQNKSEIRKYKKELKTIRNIMKGFIQQIDSLNTLNIYLTEENSQIKQQYHSAKKEHKQLSEKYEDATDKVALASVIKAINLGIETYNHKGKLTTRAKKTKRFAINFSLDENIIAPTGIKTVFIRITDPNSHVLIQDEQPMFNFDGEQIAYSSVREINYNGETTPANVYYQNMGEELLIGNYKIDIFCDGHMIGSSTTLLK